MSSNTVSRRGLTGLAPVLTIRLGGSKASRSALVSLLVLLAFGCGNDRSVTPTGPTPPPLPPPSSATLISVTLQGRVLDERAQPVGGARITLKAVTPGAPIDRTRAILPASTADDTGAFSLTVDLPENWTTVSLVVDREGYDLTGTTVRPPEATRALLINIYKSLTISPGEAIETVVSIPSGYWCGYEFKPCRRLTVNSPSGKPVDLEVIPADGQENVGLAVGESDITNGFSFPRRVTGSDGDPIAIVVSQLGRVTLRATER